MNSGAPFQIKLPPDWEDQTIYTYMGPEDSGVQHLLTLVVDRSAGKTELADYVRERRDLTLNTMPGMEMLKEEQKTLDSGFPAVEIVFKWVPSDESIIYRKQVFLIVDEIGYIFSANFSKKTIKTIGTEVDRIINSFNPKPESEDD
ncbi:MAG: DcrB-related protein [Candidatus Zixiibacteriota bacterium]